MLSSLATNFLALLNLIFGISSDVQLNHWKKVSDWTPHLNGQKIVLESDEIISLCSKNKNSFIKFPMIIHGSHKIYQNNQLVTDFNGIKENNIRSFFGTPYLSCSDVSQFSAPLRWEAFSYTKYFARMSHEPKIVSNRPIRNIFSETLNVIVGGILLFLSFFIPFTFLGRHEKNEEILLISVSAFFFSFYFILNSSSFFGIYLPMLILHRFADIGVWLGLFTMFYAFCRINMMPKKLFMVNVPFIALALIVIVFSSNGDELQFGTSIPFVPVLSSAFINLIIILRKFDKKNKEQILQLLIIIAFKTAGINEVFVITGLYDGHLLFSVGILSCLILTALTVSNSINNAYKERDDLRKNLQKKVEEQTSDLKKAFNNLKSTQAELIQKEKLASLGTLSAGIAHEINNSINYINGAIKPLIKISESGNKDLLLKKAGPLLKIADTGVQGTIEIVNSLRNYTGLNSSELQEINLKEAVQDTLTLLNSRIRNKCTVNIDIKQTHVFGKKVSLGQVLMNVFTNSLDAMEGKNGILEISSKEVGSKVSLIIKDNGTGIPQDILNKVFDPFFTTKDVGKGSGLGMTIIKKEMEKMNGDFSINSIEGEGTEVVITLDSEYDDKQIRDEAS